MHTPVGATALLSYNGHSDGRATLTWAIKDGTRRQTMVFQPYPRKVGMDQGRNVLVDLWHRLDVKIDQIRQTGDVADPSWKTQAITLAEVIQLIMPAFYPDKDNVLAESMNRWRARQAGTEHESPGLAESLWDRNTQADGTPYSRESESKARARNNGAQSQQAVVKLSDQHITFIKHSLKTGALTAEKMAEMFKVSVDVIKAANDS